MEIKYEPVFGDQSLFDGADEDVVLAETNGVYRTFHKESNKPYNVASVSRSDLAVRRIIRTPTWTVADQMAGKLPPVGSKYLAGSDKREFTCLFHGKGNGTTLIVGHTDDGKVTGYYLQYCYPIESPEEKAARLRKEWCNEAVEVCSIGMTTLTRIYDALLSGDLPVPVKDAKK